MKPIFFLYVQARITNLLYFIMLNNPEELNQKVLKVSFRAKKKTQQQPPNQYTIDYYKGKAEALLEVIKIITDKEPL